jgi:hypothetical protein
MGTLSRALERTLRHAAAAIWVVGMLVAAHLAPEPYRLAMQEDRVVEWWTALLFLAAGVIAVPRAVRGRRWGDIVVALFCVAAAGEEVSWGQRLLGYTPPPTFLEHNVQQELNLHNFRDVIGQPKWLLVAILAAYGIALPLVARSNLGRRMLDRVRLTAPSMSIVPWALVSIVVLAWYPVEFTGEWVETLAGSLFLATLGGSVASVAAAAMIALIVAIGLSLASARRPSDPDHIECARSELLALRDDVQRAATPRLWRSRRVHKRIWTAAREGYLTWKGARSLDRAPCPGSGVADAARRREYGIDPWGTAYWLLKEASDTESMSLSVYSFGPNRRRDGGGDDIVASVR